MDRKQALQALTTGALCVVYFTKRDGTERRMVCRYTGAASTFYNLRVFDVEKGAFRQVPLTRVHRVAELRTRVKQPVTYRAANRIPLPPAGFADWRGAMQELF